MGGQEGAGISNFFSEEAEIIYKNNCHDEILKNIFEIVKSGFSAPDLYLIKDDKGHEVYRWIFDNDEYFIKNFAYTRYSKRFKNLFRPCEARRIIKVYEKLLKNNISSLPIILALDYSSNKSRKKSLILSEKVYGRGLETFFNQIRADFSTRIKILGKFASFYVDMLKHKFVPGDPSLSNFMVENLDSYKITLIDLDNVKKNIFLPDIFFYKNLVKMMSIIYSRHTKLSLYEKKYLIEKILTFYGKRSDEKEVKKILQKTRKRLLKRDFAEVIDKYEELQ